MNLWELIMSAPHTIEKYGIGFILGIAICFLLWKLVGAPRLQKHDAAIEHIHAVRESNLHPVKKDLNGEPLLVNRYELLQLLEHISSRCTPPNCHAFPLIKQETDLLRNEIREHATVTAQSREAVLAAFDNFIEKIHSDRELTEKDLRIFTAKVFESRNQTHDEIVKIFDRFNSYVDGLGSRVIEALEKMSEARKNWK